MKPDLYEFTFTCDEQHLTAYGTSHDAALELAVAEADRLGLRGPIQCVDRRPFDPSGGDGPDD